MTQQLGRQFNSVVTKFWSVAAPVYDTAPLQRWLYKPAQDETVAVLRSRGARRIADIACGTGILADRIERELSTDDVFGVDMSGGMLAQAKARSSRVQWLTGPAERLPFDDGALDAVVTTSAFHFFDQPAALREFLRVLAPGGVATVATFVPPPFVPQQLFSGGGPAHSPTAKEMRALFEDAGFTLDDQHRVNRPVWTALLPDVITIGLKP